MLLIEEPVTSFEKESIALINPAIKSSFTPKE